MRKVKKISKKRKMYLTKKAVENDIKEVCRCISSSGIDKYYSTLKQLLGEYKILKKKELKK